MDIIYYMSYFAIIFFLDFSWFSAKVRFPTKIPPLCPVFDTLLREVILLHIRFYHIQPAFFKPTAGYWTWHVEIEASIFDYYIKLYKKCITQKKNLSR